MDWHDADRFWRREAKVHDIEYRVWKRHSTEIILLGLFKTEESQAPPVLLHISSKSPQAEKKKALFWAALKALKEQPRSRDFIFVLDYSGTPTRYEALENFIHYLVRAFPRKPYDLSLLEKIEAGAVWAQFPSLRDIEVALTTDLCGSPLFHPLWTYWPIETASRGWWQVTLETKGSDILDLWEDLERWIINRQQSSHPWIISSLHDEYIDMVQHWRDLLTPMKRWLSYVWPRIFFEDFSQIELKNEIWSLKKLSPSRVAVDLRFLGDREENGLIRLIRDGGFHETMHRTRYSPFRRSFARNEILSWVEEAFELYPNSRASRFIGDADSSASLFRSLGILSYDFSPVLCEGMSTSHETRSLEVMAHLFEKLAH